MYPAKGGGNASPAPIWTPNVSVLSGPPESLCGHVLLGLLKDSPSLVMEHHVRVVLSLEVSIVLFLNLF